MDPEAVARDFVKAINEHDLEALVGRMSADHRLIDSLGHFVEGPAALRWAWRMYFAMVPDYRVEVEEVFHRGEVVLLVGRASGTYAPHGEPRPENRWQTPAVWRAVTRGSKVEEWHVYSDNEPLRALMREAATGAGE